jgi:hypothetical protein
MTVAEVAWIPKLNQQTVRRGPKIARSAKTGSARPGLRESVRCGLEGREAPLLRRRWGCDPSAPASG